MPPRLTTEQFIKKARLIHDGRYGYGLVNYVDAKTKVIIQCIIHGKFEQTPSDHLCGCGCNDCGNIKIAKSQSSDVVSFVTKARIVHDGKYSYENVDYVNAKTKVDICCSLHGIFKQSPDNHLRGRGCPACKLDKLKNVKRSNTVEFIEKSKLVHGDRYDYSLVDYIASQTKVRILCNKHGVFKQNPDDHLSGYGCQKCGRDVAAKMFSDSVDDFIFKAKQYHDDKYDYSLVEYTNANTKVSIVCPDHGVFEQVPSSHINGCGCPKCVGHQSKPEFEICELIESLGLSYIHGDRKTISPQEIDILVPEVNLAIEFNGNYWHSDKQKPKDYHFEKTRLANEAGYRMIHVWEGDWETRKEQIKRIIVNACGKTNELMLNGRDCVVQEIEMRTINEFLDEHHIQGRVHTAAIKLGLIHKSEGLVAVMTFSKGANVRGTARINAEKSEVPWNLTRYAAKHSVRGGASKLFKHATRTHGLNFIESYSMNDYFTGGMYQHLGFKKTVSYSADYRVYHPRIGMKFKYHWQRRNIPNVLRDIGRDDIVFNPDKTIDSRTEFEMEDLVGALRLWDSGKTKWTWRNIVDSE